MKKQLSLIRIIQFFIILLLIGSLSQLTIILVKCASVNEIDYVPYGINVGCLPDWIS